MPSIFTHLPIVSERVVAVPSSVYPASGNITTLLLSFFTVCRISLTSTGSEENFLVGMQPILRSSQPLPKKASVVATMLKGFGYRAVATISRSMKLEWFISMNAGSPFFTFSMPIFSHLKCVALISGMEMTRIRVRKKRLGFCGFLCSCFVARASSITSL